MKPKLIDPVSIHSGVWEATHPNPAPPLQTNAPPQKKVSPRLSVLRLTIPRRVYTQSHFDYVVDTLCTIKSRADKLRGFTLTYAPQLLRHFTARVEPL
jgi:tryptophanase